MPKNIITSLKNHYELNDDQYLYDVIDYANGITADADLMNIFLDRILDGKIQSLPIRNANQFKPINFFICWWY